MYADRLYVECVVCPCVCDRRCLPFRTLPRGSAPVRGFTPVGCYGLQFTIYNLHIICKTKCNEACCQHIANIQYEHRKRKIYVANVAIRDDIFIFLCLSVLFFVSWNNQLAQSEHGRHILNLLRQCERTTVASGHHRSLALPQQVQDVAPVLVLCQLAIYGTCSSLLSSSLLPLPSPGNTWNPRLFT